MRRQKYDCVATLQQIGVSYADAEALRRISMTLHRWHELECGNDSRCIVRGNLESGEFQYADDGKAYFEVSGRSGKNRYWPTPDRETGALKRLAAILEALQNRDARAAERLMKRHILSTKPFILAAIDGPGGAAGRRR